MQDVAVLAVARIHGNVPVGHKERCHERFVPQFRCTLFPAEYRRYWGSSRIRIRSQVCAQGPGPPATAAGVLPSERERCCARWSRALIALEGSPPLHGLSKAAEIAISVVVSDSTLFASPVRKPIIPLVLIFQSPFAAVPPSRLSHKRRSVL